MFAPNLLPTNTFSIFIYLFSFCSCFFFSRLLSKGIFGLNYSTIWHNILPPTLDKKLFLLLVLVTRDITGKTCIYTLNKYQIIQPHSVLYVMYNSFHRKGLIVFGERERESGSEGPLKAFDIS